MGVIYKASDSPPRGRAQRRARPTARPTTARTSRSPRSSTPSNPPSTRLRARVCIVPRGRVAVPSRFRLVLHEQRTRTTKHKRSTRRATPRAAHRPSPRLFADHRRLRARETRACDVIVPCEPPNPRRRRANPRPRPRTPVRNILVGLPRPATLFSRGFSARPPRPAPSTLTLPLPPSPTAGIPDVPERVRLRRARV